MGEAGWRALGGSFAASAGLTVSLIRRNALESRRLMLSRTVLQFLSLLFPVLYAMPVFDIFGGNFASGWLWT